MLMLVPFHCTHDNLDTCNAYTRHALLGISADLQGMTSASHVERDEQAGLTYDFTMDLNYRLNGTYNVFCIPDNVEEEPYLLAQIQDTPCYVHR